MDNSARRGSRSRFLRGRWAWALALAMPLLACQTTPEPAAAPEGRPSGVEPDNPPPEPVVTTALTAEVERPPQVSLYPGSGSFINRRAARGQPSGLRELNGGLELQFDGVDIRELVHVVFTELGLNYFIDHAVQGQVTVHTSGPLAPDALLPTLETLLRANGAALLEEGDLYRVVPLANAVSGNLSPRLGVSRGAGYGVRIFPLQYVAATEMENILRPFAPEGGILLVDATRNLLILAGTPQELETLAETIDIFDVNWLEGMSVGLFVLENVDAQTLATELEGVLSQGPDSAMGGLLRFVPVTRLNALIVISPQPDYLQQAAVWIERLDGAGGQRLYIYEVQNGDADYLAGVLSEVFNASGGGSSRSGGRVAPGRTPTTLTSPGTVGSNNEERESAFGLMQATASPPQAPAEPPARREGSGNQPVRLGPSGGGVASASGGGGDDFDELRIIPDVQNNSLLIWANPQTYEKILGALQSIDITPRQVLIEATIAEVTLSGALEYGLQWFFKNGLDINDLDGRAVLGFNTSTQTLDNALSPLDVNEFAYVVTNSAGFVRGLLRTLAAESKLQILSSPQVLVVDNQQAEIRVGTEQPVVSTVVDDGITTESVQFRDTGVTLRVQPKINASGLVLMDVEQEVIDVGEEDPVAGQRSFFERVITSRVVVKSGQTIVLGGLIEEEVRDTRGGVPFLYKVPVVGPLFGTTAESSSRTELLVLLTPRVLQDTEDATRITEEIRRRMNRLLPFLEDDLQNNSVNLQPLPQLEPLTPGVVDPDGPNQLSLPDPTNPAPAAGEAP
ncbi:MAG: type II secretion system secretin GspD [Candidatus Competibacterales bacterium]